MAKKKESTTGDTLTFRGDQIKFIDPQYELATVAAQLAEREELLELVQYLRDDGWGEMIDVVLKRLKRNRRQRALRRKNKGMGHG